MPSNKNPKTTVNWDDVERTAFAKHPNVVAQLKPTSGKNKKPNMLLGAIVGIPLVLVYLFFWTSPIWGLAAVIDSRFHNYRQDPAEQIPVGGTLFIFALAMVLFNIIHWFIVGRKRKNNGLAHTQAGMTVVLGFFATLVVAMKGTEHAVDNWQLWILPIISSTILGLILFFMIFLADLKRKSSKNNIPTTKPETMEVATDLPPNMVERFKQIKAELNELSDEEKQEVQTKLTKSINRMVRRGTITQNEADKASRISLGELGLRMKP